MKLIPKPQIDHRGVVVSSGGGVWNCYPAQCSSISRKRWRSVRSREVGRSRNNRRVHGNGEDGDGFRLLVCWFPSTFPSLHRNGEDGDGGCELAKQGLSRKKKETHFIPVTGNHPATGTCDFWSSNLGWFAPLL